MDVSFSDRLSSIVALSSALITSGKGNGADVREEARLIESEVHSEARSNEEYHRLCAGVVKAHSHVPEPSNSDSEPTDPSLHGAISEILNPDGPPIGPYTQTTFHASGQTSTILKAKAPPGHPSYPSQIVALKLTPLPTLPPHNPHREARLLQTAAHEHVIRLLSSFTTHNPTQFVLAFPFLRQDLENLLRTSTLTNSQSSQIFTALFSALAHIHSLGLIHRDIKPSNILLASMHGPVYLSDFGITWSPTDSDSEPADAKLTDVGTTSYRPPELLFGYRAYDCSLDMWAAGCVVAELLKPDHRPLFDAGPLGSELGLIKSMFTTLGTPDDKVWPSAKTYPDWNKMVFQSFPPKPWSEILPTVSDAGIAFVQRTVCFESTRRLTAIQAIDQAALLGW